MATCLTKRTCSATPNAALSTGLYSSELRHIGDPSEVVHNQSLLHFEQQSIAFDILKSCLSQVYSCWSHASAILLYAYLELYCCVCSQPHRNVGRQQGTKLVWLATQQGDSLKFDLYFVGPYRTLCTLVELYAGVCIKAACLCPIVETLRTDSEAVCVEGCMHNQCQCSSS